MREVIPMRIAEVILKYLKDNGVDHIFGIPAGTVSPLYDSLNDVDIKPIVAKNEGGAAYMAARYASVTGKLGVCIGAGGVGVNNMMNGIADAMRGKAPVLIITGYVNRWQIGKGAIQELDTQDILKPITKYSKTLLDEHEVMKEIANAIKLAYTVPMGPVHLSIPIDIQLLECEEALPHSLDILEHAKSLEASLNEELLIKACNIMNENNNGVILVGKGCRGITEQIVKLSTHLQWPVITTPEGKGVISSDYPLNYGNYGFASTDAANDCVTDVNTTCILVLGTSLGENATSNFSPALFKGKKSIHIDWDIRELGKVYDTDVAICQDMKVAIPYMLEKLDKKNKKVQEKPILNKPTNYSNTGISLKAFAEKLPSVMPKDTYYLSDMGEFMNFVFKYLSIPEGGDFETNLNYAAMGHAIGGAVGVQIAYPNRTTAVFAGDGCFFMNGNEILTAKEYKLPIIYFIINNSMLGFVEHGHNFLFERVVDGFKQERVNISEVMKAYGVNSMQVVEIEDMEKISDFIKGSNGPSVIEIITDGSEPAPNGDRLKSLQNR
jgi:acetolactate synthase-1/2/3 large subunit